MKNPIDREELLKTREQLVEEIKTLQAKPLSSKSVAAATFRAEDINKLAKTILGIDKKLGRI